MIHQEDRNWLRIFYKFKDELEEFRLKTVTYGTASAPYQALRVMKQIAIEASLEFSEVSEILLKQTYVDDIFGGASSVEKTCELKNQLIKVLAKAEIPLGKWSSNNPQILHDLTEVSTEVKSLDLVEVVSTLGLKWKPTEDEFFFVIDKSSNLSVKATKRAILSETSKLFDPLGWVSPAIIPAKILLQELWILGLDWDVPLDSKMAQRWSDIRTQMENIGKITIPRWFHTLEQGKWSLHGFSDASKRAYAAALFLVTDSGDSFLICSKTRVAPVKTLSIPRLELLGAELLAKLVDYISPTFPFPPDEVHCWCDSRNVLCWLMSNDKNWGVFVAHRVGTILTILPNVRWKYVASKDNPADLATRGISGDELAQSKLWWKGPSWLNDKSKWPKNIIIPETREINVHLINSDHNDWISEVSSFKRLCRLTAIILRWKKVHNGMSFSSFVTVPEFLDAEKRLIQLDQSQYFSAEIKNLKLKQNIPNKSCLLRLNPFMDDQGILRVGGRLGHCSFLSYDEKFPIILDKRSHIAKIMILDIHKETLHGGPQLILSHLLRKYWVVHGKRIARQIYQKCVRCIRHSGKAATQQMASLPSIRITPERAFLNCGLDYAGPIQVRMSKGRGYKSSKGYIAIFICLITKAIHIEIVTDFTTQSFLACFKRFISRRGLPAKVYSDNGSTFQGADREIKNFFLKNSPFSKVIVENIEKQGVHLKRIILI